jgi:hypothetical protein
VPTPPDLARSIEDITSRRTSTIAVLLGEVDDAMAALRREVTEMESELAGVSAQVAALPVPPVAPSNRGTFFGYTDANPTGLVKPKVLRMFTGTTSPTGLSQTNLARTDCAKWVSWKPSASTSMANPSTWAPQAVAYLKTKVPKTTPCYMTVWHEPEGNRPAGLTVAQWIARWQGAQAALYDLCVQARSEGFMFYVAPVICDWTHKDTSKGAAWDWYSPSFTKYDVMGWDCYPTGQKADGSTRICRLAMDADYKPSTYASTTRWDSYRYHRACAKLAADRGKPWGSGECGVIAGKLYGGDSKYLYTLEQRAARFTQIHDDLLSLPNPPLLWSWWNNDSASVSTMDDPAGRAAFNKSITNSPQGLPTL